MPQQTQGTKGSIRHVLALNLVSQVEMKPVSEGRDGNINRRTYKILKMQEKNRKCVYGGSGMNTVLTYVIS